MRTISIWMVCLLFPAVLNTPVAQADYGASRAGITPLYLGVFPRRNASVTTRLFTPLAEYLSEELDHPVKLMTSKDFASFWGSVEQGRYDIVHYNQYHYIRSSDVYEVFAQNEEFGNRTIGGALFVRQDSGIDSVEQLRGRKIIFGGGPNAMMSHIVPRYLLQKSGLKPGDYEEDYATSPPNSMMAVYYRQADAAGAGDVVPSLPVVSKRIDTDAIRLLKQSKPLSHLPWAMKRSLPTGLREQIRRLFHGLKDTSRSRYAMKSANLTGIHPAVDSDYDAHREIVTAINESKD